MNPPGVNGSKIRVPCIACDGAGCKDCRGWGYVLLAKCPREAISPATWRFVDDADDYRKHRYPPVAGGKLDQSAQFVTACRYFWQQESFCKAKRGLPE